ncbi:MAG: hypothetical protein JJE53_00905 [Candidatus Pacebacteria bacterium]|nr:hypothetical protein [Candidatus Paceibacterota bacterium]
MKTNKKLTAPFIVFLSVLLFMFGINMRQILHDPIYGVKIGNIMTLFGLSILLMMALVALWDKAEKKLVAEVKSIPEIVFSISLAIWMTLFSLFFVIKMIVVILFNKIILIPVDEKILTIVYRTLTSEGFWYVFIYINLFFLMSTYFVMKKNKK